MTVNGYGKSSIIDTHNINFGIDFGGGLLRDDFVEGPGELAESTGRH